MTEKKKTGVGPGTNPRMRSVANQARLREFLEQCSRGEANLPTRGLRVNYVALSHMLFSTHSSIRAGNLPLRKLVEEYVAKHPVTYAGDNKSIRSNAATMGLLDTANLSATPGLKHRETGLEIVERLHSYLDRCLSGEIALPRNGNKPNYWSIAKNVLGDDARRYRFGQSIYKPLIDKCFDQVYSAEISHVRDPLPVTFEGLLRTGSVSINTSATHVAVVDWDADSFRTKMPAVESAVTAHYTLPAAFTKTFESWREITTQKQLVNWLNRVLATNLFHGTSLGLLPWFVLCEMRHRGLLLSTIGFAAQVVPPPFTKRFSRRLVARFTTFELKLVEHEGKDGIQILGLLLCMGPLNKISDFPLDEFKLVLLAMMNQFPAGEIEQRKFLGFLRRLARALDRAALEDHRPYHPLARVQLEQVSLDGGWRRKGIEADPLTLPINPVVLEWGHSFRRYVDAQHWKTPGTRISRCRAVLTYLECEFDPPPLHAEDLRNRMFGAEHRLYDWLCNHGPSSRALETMRTLLHFFKWYSGLKPQFLIPLRESELPPSPGRRGKSNKPLIPRTILDEAKRICRELIEATFSQQTYLPDTILCVKQFTNLLACKFAVPGIGLVEQFVPVLPVLLYTVLTLPIRSIQARLLDSGEADDEIPMAPPGDTPISERVEWLSNISPLARRGRAEGWLRRIRDTSVWKDYLGFWINTNKTAAVGRGDAQDFGYQIPWQHDELISILMRLRDWQISNNPIKTLTSRGDLFERILRPTAALAKLMPPYAYLFRHPKESDLTCWHEPVRYESMNQFFLSLMDEIETRRRNTPNEVQLVLSRDSINRPASANFTIHGLRVAGITAFAEAGVPAPIIAEFLAGHLTVLMTVYYQRFGPATVTRMLNDALQGLERKRMSDALAGAHDIEHLRGMFVSEQIDALNTAADVNPGLWALKIDGACPNGQTRCAEGGARNHSSMYGPVPGGARNCPLCRFWLTGTVFIAGQAITLNAELYKLREKSEVLVNLHARLRTLEAGDGKRDAVEHSIDAIEAEIDLIIRTLQARYRLVMASLQLSEKKSPAGANQTFFMVSPGGRDDAKASLTEVTDFRMLDFLSRSIEIFPEIDCGSAAFKRNLFLDQLLEKEGFEAMLFRLPTETANRIGNAFGKFLGELAGDKILDSVAEGTRSLRSLGIERVQDGMEMILGQPIRFVPRPPPPSLDQPHSKGDVLLPN